MAKILIIDDEKLIVEMLAFRLAKVGGYEVVQAFDGDEGMKKAAAEKPDLVLVDIMMPKMDGHQFIINMKKDPALSSIPIIVLTASVSLDLVAKALKSGAAGYILKPFDPNKLMEKVKEALEGRKK